MVSPPPSAFRVLPGSPEPRGARHDGEGVNFSLHAPRAEKVELCLFPLPGGHEQRLVLPGRSGHLHHGYVPSAGPGLEYGYRVHGPWRPEHGHRFEPARLLLDPRARAVTGPWGADPALYGSESGGPTEVDTAPWAPRGRVEPERGPLPGPRPRVPWRDTVIYELHVKGFTRLHPEVPQRLRGTYLGIARPAVVDYLLELGVTTVELMPCQAFASERRLLEAGLSNYWGYNPYALFAPHPAYALEDPVAEFRAMAATLHEAGIELVLDVVFNHTAEAGTDGPGVSWRGIDNAGYYLLDPADPSRYRNYSGCGNSLDTGRPEGLRLVMDCLRHWATELGVDGFRFDLAASLLRVGGEVRQDAPLLAAVHQDPVLAPLKLIAEPWDLGPGGYRLGGFPPPWAEWNDRYRDGVRTFWRGDAGRLPEFAERIAGSSDLFRQPGRAPWAGVNYVACHDGFTLADTVSYTRKRNEANREGNRDGHVHNASWNCGAEGPTEDAAVLGCRRRHIRNMLATLFLSRGTPMLSAGDEAGRSQGGNNNAYCQDNRISWLDWRSRDEAQAALVRRLARLRRAHPVLTGDAFLGGLAHPVSGRKDVAWLREDGAELAEADWHDPTRRCMGVLYDGADPAEGHRRLLLLFNAGEAEVAFALPGPASARWMLVLDTTEEETAPRECGAEYRLAGGSLAVLTGREEGA